VKLPGQLTTMTAVRDDPDLPWFDVFFVCLNYIVIGIIRYIGEMWDKAVHGQEISTKSVCELFPWFVITHLQGYAPMFISWDSFWVRKMYRKISDCWNRPVNSCPGAHIRVVERVSDDNNETFTYVRLSLPPVLTR
jgi:serine palmitoyltransferase